MNYLIDTHILLWYLVGDRRIDDSLQGIIESDRNTVFLSNASMWEIAIKISIGNYNLMYHYLN